MGLGWVGELLCVGVRVNVRWGVGVACVSIGGCGSYFSILPYPFPSADFWAGVCRLDWWVGSIPSQSLHVPLVLSVGAARGAIGSIKGLGHHFR
jgi:hypothetical protein